MSTPNLGKMDAEGVGNEANIMEVQSLKSYSESSEGSGVNILTPTASEAGPIEASDITQELKPFENDAVILDDGKSDEISDWVDETVSARSEQTVDMTLIQNDETNSLEGSAYELIDDDIESSHGGETESISDCSVGRPSDVVSLADDEKSMDDTESDASVSHSAIPAYAGLDDNEDTPRVGLSTANIHTEDPVHDAHLARLQHIAFKESEVDGVETESQVSVMHTIKEFSKDEADAIAIQIGSDIYPRLVGTIRQTMTKEYLSLKEPLRIMYIGSHQARQDILQKLGSSVAASRDDKGHGVQSTQLYNVVPISAFGSGKTPEVELTQSSAVQFKICDLEKAVRENVADSPNDRSIITLTLDHNSQVRSVPLTRKFEIEPANWEKPHLAIFYCSETDTAEMMHTRQIANSFMQRHNIPRIVISHNPWFDTPKINMKLGHQPIHMCLESRDPAKSSSSIHFRLPIDLTSFLNIDARQMNRNLACITGLYGAPALATKVEKKDYVPFLVLTPMVSAAVRKVQAWIANEYKELCDVLAVGGNQANTLQPLQLLLMCLAVSIVGFTFGYFSPGMSSVKHDIVHHNGTVAPVISSTIASSMSSVMSTSYSTTTRTTTITQTVTHAPTSTTITPPKVTDKAPGPDSAMDLISSFTTAELQGERLVVLRTTKANIDQMKRDPNLDFRLWRESLNASQPCNMALSNYTLVWDKASWVENGVSILLKKEDIHGSLKIGVESMATDGRKIRKTYTVKLSDAPENVVTFKTVKNCFQDEVIPLLASDISNTFSAMSVRASRQANLLAHKSQDIVRDARAKFNEAKLKERMARKIEKMKKVQAQIAKQAQKTEQMADKMQKSMNEKLLKAQVKSRLIWLRKRGMYKEAKEYEAKASKAGVLKTNEIKAQLDDLAAKAAKSVEGKKKRSCPRGIGRKARKCRAAARLGVAL